MKIHLMKNICVFIFIFIITGCSNEPIKPILVKSTADYDVYDVHYEFKTEQWDDPDILSTPRLQFTWVKPGSEERDISIWTMRLDGTDLRQVVSVELMDTPTMGGTNSIVQFERSQNNRYIAFSLHTKRGGVERRIIDLKTKTVKIIDSSFGDPDFGWFANSRYLLFGSRAGLTQYDLETEKTTYLGDAFAGVERVSAYFPYDNGNKIVIEDTKRISRVYDFKTRKLLKEFKGRGDYIASDSRFWLRDAQERRNSRLYTAKLETPMVPMQYFPSRITPFITTSVKGRVYAHASNGVVWANPGDKKVTYFKLPGKKYLYNLSVTNAHASFED